MTKVFIDTKSASPIFTEVDSTSESDWQQVNKTLHIGNENKDSIHSYNNFVVKTVANDTHKSTLEINLKTVTDNSSAEELTIKLRKVQICDDNGNNAFVYMLCSEAFEADSGFVAPPGLE